MFALRRFTGHWELNVPAVDLLVLTGKRAKVRLLHGQIKGICGDIHVLGGHEFVTPLNFVDASKRAASKVEQGAPLPAGVEQEALRRVCLLALSIDSFVLTAPDKLNDFRNTMTTGEDIRDMLHGAPPEIVRVVQPVRLGDPKSDGMEAARATGRRTNGSISFAVFASLCQGMGGECEVHLADLDVVASDRLLERIRAFAGLGKSERSGEIGSSWSTATFLSSRSRTFPTMQSGGTGRRGDGASVGGIFRRMRSSFSTRVSSGPGADEGRHSSFISCTGHARASTIDFDDAESGFAEVTRIYQEDLTVGQLRSNQKLYEQASRLIGLHGDVDVCYHVGAIHMVKVSEYSEANLCVFQARVHPFTFSDRDDKVACDAARCGLDHSKISLEFNCFADDDRRPSIGSSIGSNICRICPGCGTSPADCYCDAMAFDLNDRGLDNLGFLDLNGHRDAPRHPDCARSETYAVRISILPWAHLSAAKCWIPVQAAEWRAELQARSAEAPTRQSTSAGSSASTDTGSELLGDRTPAVRADHTVTL